MALGPTAHFRRLSGTCDTITEPLKRNLFERRSSPRDLTPEEYTHLMASRPTFVVNPCHTGWRSPPASRMRHPSFRVCPSAMQHALNWAAALHSHEYARTICASHRPTPIPFYSHSPLMATWPKHTISHARRVIRTPQSSIPLISKTYGTRRFSADCRSTPVPGRLRVRLPRRA